MFYRKDKMTIKIDGMGCAHCAKKVEETLLNIENVKSAKVNLKEKKATITTNGVVDKMKIREKIENLDYIVKEIEDGKR